MNLETYRMHCPEAAPPIVTFLGIVEKCGGRLNDGPTLLHYDLQATVYDSSSRDQITFPISVYLKNGNRWINFPRLAIQSPIFVAGRLCGITIESPHLAVIADDIYFVQGPLRPMTPSSASSTQKQSDRWGQRAPTTPSKRTSLPSSTLTPNNQTSLYETVPESNTTESVQTIEESRDSLETWAETPNYAESSQQATSPTPERRSKRPRNSSYADFLS
jgi:hypothetical protein